MKVRGLDTVFRRLDEEREGEETPGEVAAGESRSQTNTVLN
jgi:hypothetical protein